MLMKTKLLAIMGAAALTGASASAGAGAEVVAPTQVFNFKGTCTDCKDFGVGELTLRNYAYGSTIDTSNFVSFHYDGTNLQSAFTITSPFYLGGSISGPGTTMDTVYLFDTEHFFSAQASGTWSLGPTLFLADVGTAGTFTLAAPGAAAVPEPAAWALTILGMGAIGSAMRRRRKVTVRVACAA